ncbi:MAG: hypothetical protein J2P47_01440, partial [Acetobacteraceae bacterium]|nr:hypothetical protein [Acetobacteraceae bacterium]
MCTRLSERVGIDDTGRVAIAAFLGQGETRSGVFVAGQNAITPIATVRTAAPGGGHFVSFAGALSLAGDGRV